MGNFEDTTFDEITIEPGSHGATYHSNDGFTVYGHKTYGSNSVLEGQAQRCYLDHFDTVEDAKANYPTAEVISGSTYQSVYISRTAPDWFDPDDAGEVWSDPDGDDLADEEEW